MENKFDMHVFVGKNNGGFLEYPSIEALAADAGEAYKEKIVGYFPAGSNITYQELEGMQEETHWTVAYHQGEDGGAYSYQKLLHVHSTLELKIQLDAIIQDAYNGKDYVNLYKTEDIVYL